MAEKKEKEKKEEAKIVLERTYNVPLRREWIKVPRYKRSKKAVSALRRFIKKHMKANEVKLGKYANEEIWKHGIRNPPHHIKIVAKKDGKGVVFAEIEGAPAEDKKTKLESEGKKKEKAGKKEEEAAGKEIAARKEEKAELKALKKEKSKAPAKQAAAPKRIEKKVTVPVGR